MHSISQALSGKVLFLTGATGFLAKGLLEKTLRNAPDVKRIYLFIRPRGRAGKRISAAERLESEVFQSSAFSRLRAELGEAFDPFVHGKVEAVSGNLTEPGLGISPEVHERLLEEVDFVINYAGTVVFDEPLDLALKVNTLGPGRIAEFARDCKDAALIHVSTAYVNGQRTGSIPETLLPPGRTVAHLLGNSDLPEFDLQAEIESIQAFCKKVEEQSKSGSQQDAFRRQLERQNRGKRVTEYRTTHQQEALRQRWVHKQLVDEGIRWARQLGWHDSYTLTKAMGEQLVVANRGEVPTAIVRPSIVESSLRDPEPGWLEDLKVADPLIVHYSKGRLPDFPIDPDIVLDVVPVDILANTVLAVLPRVREQKEVQVYHVATGARNPIRAGEIFNLVYGYFKKNPMLDRNGKPIVVRRWKFPSLKQFKRRYRLQYQIPLHILMWAMDRLAFLPWPSRLKRRASMTEATLERVLALSEIYSAYTTLDCRFETENIRRLYEELSPEDQEIFNFDVEQINWREYMQDIHIPGLKRHVLKEADPTM